MSTTATLPRVRAYQPVLLPRQIIYWVPLALILAVQTVQASRLLSSPASFDEARYIYAGHALINEILHGGGSPYYETYYSGAPVIYCPLAGIADSIGGLVAVRLMSLAFLLLATWLLFAATRRAFGYPAALAACALFSAVKLTYFVATYASYDSLALLFLAVALYCAMRSEDAPWLLVLPLALLMANATKYMTVLFDPVIVAVAALQVPRRFWARALTLGTVTVLIDLLALFLAGTSYLQGVMFSTLTRKAGGSALLGATVRTPMQIITETRSWIGIVVALAALGVLLAALRKDDRSRLPPLVVLAVAGVLVTLEGLHLHSDESMNQHDDFSAFFAAVPAGYVATWVMHQARRVKWLACVAAAALACALVPVFAQGDPVRIFTLNGEQTTPAQYRLFADLKPYFQQEGQNYLISGNTDYALLYVAGIRIPWYRYDDDSYIKYPIPGRGGDIAGTVRGPDCTTVRPGCIYLSGPAGYAAAIHAHFFASVTLVGRNLRSSAEMLGQDVTIAKAAEATPGYVLLTTEGGAPTWIYLPDYQHHPPALAAFRKALRQFAPLSGSQLPDPG